MNFDDALKGKLEDLGIKSEYIDNIIDLYKKRQNVKIEESLGANDVARAEINKLLATETDWRKRAALRAKMISLDFE